LAKKKTKEERSHHGTHLRKEHYTQTAKNEIAGAKNLMIGVRFVKNPRFFLCLGFGLILLALICLPTRVKIVVQPEVMETELLYIGPLVALLVGLWGLPNLLLGIIETSTSKGAVSPWLVIILCVVNVVLAGALWDAIRFWRDMLDRWLIAYSPILIPCMATNMIGFLYLVKSEKLTKTLENPKIKIILGIALTIFPFLVAGVLLYMWLML
jgi:hypothetical protein